MTIDERRDPDIINGSRRRRIAKGSGTKVQDVNRLLKQFKQTKKMMKQVGDMQKGMDKGNLGGGKFPFM
jgi:signal recognition particle subunit SRP54